MTMMKESIDIDTAEPGFETLFELNPAPMLVHHMDTQRVLAVNRAALELTGLDRATLLSLSLEDLRHPAESERFEAALQDFARGISKPGVWRYTHPNGSTLFVQGETRAVEFQGQHAAISVLRDVTLERRAIRAMETSERRFRDLFQHTLGFICTHDLDGVLLSVNPAAADSLGYSVGELLGSSLRDLIPEALRDNFPGYLQRLLDRGSDRGLLVLCHRDGNLRTWQYHNRLFEDADGSVSVMGSAQDITELRAAEDAARRSEQRIRTITDALPLRVGFIDPDMRYVYVNAYYERYFGRRREDIIGMKVGEVIDDESFARRRSRLKRALAGEYQHFEDESGGGRDFACEQITLLPEWSESGDRVLGVHVMVQDATARKLEEIRLTKLAQLDQLTGLLNRSGYNDRLQRALQRSDDQEMSLALLYLDLDGFKPVNDQHGHAAGDRLLHLLARRLQHTVRMSDTLARLGGDEFAVIMEGVSSSKTAVAMSERIIRAVQDPFVLTDEQGSITVQVGTSIGIALHSESAESAETLNRRADEALYEAKHAGRGTWRLAEAA